MDSESKIKRMTEYCVSFINFISQLYFVKCRLKWYLLTVYVIFKIQIVKKPNYWLVIFQIRPTIFQILNRIHLKYKKGFFRSVFVYVFRGAFEWFRVFFLSCDVDCAVRFVSVKNNIYILKKKCCFIFTLFLFYAPTIFSLLTLLTSL